MNTTELCFGQKIDEEVGLIMPWLTHGALDKIKQIDLSGSIVLMYGAGMGDVWLSKRCKELHIVERNSDWISSVMGNKISNKADNIFYYQRPCNDSSGMDEMYCELPVAPDVIIVDDAYRYECIVKAVEYSKIAKKPILLIVDNWMQDYVFLCPKAEELLLEYKQEIHIQSDHKDHEGNCWKTAIFYL